MLSILNIFYSSAPYDAPPRIDVIPAPNERSSEMNKDDGYKKFTQDFQGYNIILDKGFLQRTLSGDLKLSKEFYEQNNVKIPIPNNVISDIYKNCVCFNGKELNDKSDDKDINNINLTKHVYEKIFNEFCSSEEFKPFSANATNFVARLCAQTIFAEITCSFYKYNISHLGFYPSFIPTGKINIEIDSKSNKIISRLEQFYKIIKIENENQPELYTKVSMLFKISKEDLLNGDITTNKFVNSECLVNISPFFNNFETLNNYHYHNIKYENDNDMFEFTVLTGDGDETNNHIYVNSQLDATTLSNEETKTHSILPSDAKNQEEYENSLLLFKGEKIYESGAVYFNGILDSNPEEEDIILDFKGRKILIPLYIAKDTDRLYDVFINTNEIKLPEKSDDEKYKKTKEFYLQLLNIVNEPTAKCITHLWNQRSFSNLLMNAYEHFYNKGLNILPELNKFYRCHYLNIENNKVIVSTQMYLKTHYINSAQSPHVKIAMITELPISSVLDAEEMLRQSNVEVHYSPVYPSLNEAMTHQFSIKILPTIHLESSGISNT